MKRIITDCDCCGKNDVPTGTIFIVTSRQTDPAGSMEDFGENFDLCTSCLVAVIHRQINRDYAANKELCQWIKHVSR